MKYLKLKPVTLLNNKEGLYHGPLWYIKLAFKLLCDNAFKDTADRQTGQYIKASLLKLLQLFRSVSQETFEVKTSNFIE